MSHIVEKDWITQAGLRAVVVLIDAGSPFSWRCGYVGVPKTHPWFGKDYEDEGPINCNVHRGLTYADNTLCVQLYDTDLWWFGYDCAHSGDGLFSDGDRKTLKFCIEQCESLAKQLAQAKGG
jgi:hypothetical protein